VTGQQDEEDRRILQDLDVAGADAVDNDGFLQIYTDSAAAAPPTSRVRVRHRAPLRDISNTVGRCPLMTRFRNMDRWFLDGKENAGRENSR
jgi:hypothetical protein